MFKFIYKYDKNSPTVDIRINEDSTLEECLGAFEDFLKMAGYTFHGHIEIIKEKE